MELIKSRQVMGAAVEKMRLDLSAEPLNKLDRLLHQEGRIDLMNFSYNKDLLPSDFCDEPWHLVAKDSLGNFDLYDYKDSLVLSGEVGKTYHFVYAGDSASFGIFKAEVREGQDFAISKYKRLDAIAKFRSAFDVKEKGKKTGILEFSYQDIYPDRGVEVLNEVASSYLRQNVEERNAEAQKTLEFLEKQLPDVKAQMDSSLLNLNTYRNQVGSVDINAETQLVLQRRMRLQQDILALQQKKQEAIRLFHAEHPTVKTLEDQENALKRELAGTSSEVKKLPATQQEVLKLQNEVELTKVMYTSLLNNIQQLRLVSAGEVGSVRIVDFAEQVTKPTKPKKRVILCFALFIGFLFGAMIVSIKSKFSSGVKSSSFIEKETGFTVYAKVPKGNPKGPREPGPLLWWNPMILQWNRCVRFALLWNSP